MADTHRHEDQSTYYVGQILTIAACGAIAGVCILLYTQGGLFNILKSDQHLPVLLGGVGLLLLVLIRAGTAWFAVRRSAVVSHTRIQADGVGLWRYALMILPVVLFLLGLPRAGGMNADPNSIDYCPQCHMLFVNGVAAKGEWISITLDQLVQATSNPDLRDGLAGTTVRLSGQYKGDQSDRFTLVRFKVDDHDGMSLKAVIIVDPKAGNFPVNPDTYRNHWVQITGRLEFTKDLANDFIPVIRLTPKKADDQDVVKIVPPDSNL